MTLACLALSVGFIVLKRSYDLASAWIELPVTLFICLVAVKSIVAERNPTTASEVAGSIFLLVTALEHLQRAIRNRMRHRG